jgi:LacI family transcriptional regulator
VSKPGLKEIASGCGVTKMTVSRALRGAPGVSDQVRAAICAEAQRVGYTPDPVLSKLLIHLRQGRKVSERETIALLWPDASGDLIAISPILSCIRASFRARAAKSGFRVTEFYRHQPGLSGRRLASIFKARGIQAVCIGLLSGPAQPASFNIPLDDFSCAAMGISLESLRLHRAQFHHGAGIQRAMEELVRVGFKRPALALTRSVHERTRRVFAGIFSQHHPNPGAADRLLFLFDEQPTGLDKWLDDRKPDALIYEQPAPPLEARTAIASGMAFVTLNREGPTSPYPGIDQRYDILASNAADLLIGQFLRNERGPSDRPKFVMHEGDWVGRGLDFPKPISGSAKRRLQPIP